MKKTLKVYPKKLMVAATKPSLKTSLYDKDFCAWTKKQATLLQKGDLDKLDRDHLREEIESLGISLERALESYLTNLLMHKLKIKFQPAKHTRSWDLTLKNALFQIQRLLKKNPSLKASLEETVEAAYFSARLEAAKETGLAEKKFPVTCPWELEEIFEDIKPEK